MITLRKAEARGHAHHGWLDTWHTFSFADYYDPEHVGFRNLRVINDDTIAPSMGFGEHAHRDMEIVTCVLSGAGAQGFNGQRSHYPAWRILIHGCRHRRAAK